MTEFEVQGQTYRAGKLNAFQQLHLSRKIAPILPKLLPAFAQLAGRTAEQAPDLEQFAAAVEPLAEALAAMSEADCEYVFGMALSAVQRRQEKGWAAVWNAPSKALMFDDIELPAMIQIVIKVVQDSLGPFTEGLLEKARAISPAP